MGGPADATPLLDALRDDPRVRGVVRLAAAEGTTRLVVATTWDGHDALAGRLPELVARVLDVADAVVEHDGGRLTALTASGDRVELRVERVSDLRPSAEGESAEPLLDPQGLLAQWVEWSAGRPRPPVPAGAEERDAARRVLRCDELLRSFEALPPGRVLLRGDGDARPVRHAVGTRLRAQAAALHGLPGADALRARVQRALESVPHPGAGLRVTGPGARERFLAVADAEGFAGDRVLLDAAEVHARAALGRPLEFEVGFALATFDQVEARYAVGEAVGGCKPPLVPGLLVGVAVTPADELAFWAAPTLREPVGDAACIADDGRRAVLARSAGKEALLATLCTAVDEALDALPSLLARARGAHRERPEDPGAMLRELHLPRTHVQAAALHGALAPGTSRLTSALALARAAGDVEPVVARKLELAAGRLLLGAEARDDGCGTG